MPCNTCVLFACMHAFIHDRTLVGTLCTLVCVDEKVSWGPVRQSRTGWDHGGIECNCGDLVACVVLFIHMFMHVHVRALYASNIDTK